MSRNTDVTTPTISFSQTSTHPPTPSLVVARLPFNLIIRASNILPWEYCLSHFQIFARAIVVKVWMWDILRWHIPPGWAFLMGVECIPFQPKHPPTSSVTRPCVQTLLRIGGYPLPTHYGRSNINNWFIDHELAGAWHCQKE